MHWAWTNQNTQNSRRCHRAKTNKQQSQKTYKRLTKDTTTTSSSKAIEGLGITNPTINANLSLSTTDSLLQSHTKVSQNPILSTSTRTSRNLSRQMSFSLSPSAAAAVERGEIQQEPKWTKYKLIFFVPPSHLEQCKDAIFATGAGSYPQGKYSRACFQTMGTGQFLPGDEATPSIGHAGSLEKVEEMKVEVLCLGRAVMMTAVDALLAAHPYEEPAYEVYKLESV